MKLIKSKKKSVGVCRVSILVLSAAFALVAAVAVPAAEKITLTFRQNDSPVDAAGLPEAVEEFNQKHPNIRVKYETAPWSDALPQFIREARSEGGPDVLQSAFVWTMDLAKAGTLIKLNSLIEESPMPVGIDDFKAVKLGELDGGIYGIPWTTDTHGIVYDKDLFEEAGISTFPDDSWSHFKTVAKKLVRDKDGDGITDQYGFGVAAGSGPAGEMWFLVNYYVWSNGYSFMKQMEDGHWQVDVDAEQIAEAMRYFNSFFEEGISPRSLIGINWEGDPELLYGIAKGDLVMGFIALQSLASVKDMNPKASIWSAQTPAGRVTRIAHLGGRTLVINKNTKHLKEAWELLKWMCSKRVFEKYYRQQLPAQKTLLNQISYGPEYEGFAKLIPQGQTFYEYIISPVRVQTMWALTNRHFGAVFSGQKSAEQASKDLIKDIEKALQEAIK